MVTPAVTHAARTPPATAPRHFLDLGSKRTDRGAAPVVCGTDSPSAGPEVVGSDIVETFLICWLCFLMDRVLNAEVDRIGAGALCR